jgi:mono/diheme cytochrome c family protein
VSSQRPELRIQQDTGVPEQESESRPNLVDGIYTVRQASRGQQTFQRICTTCHTISEFSGPGFMRSWEGKYVGNLLELIATRMPLDNPGSLSAADYAAIVAYILRENEFQPGDVELSTAWEDSYNIAIQK